MGKRTMYYGLDLLKLGMALLVAGRHMIQVFYGIDSKWRLLVGSWLSNLAVPVFFIIAGFLLFRKIPEAGAGRSWFGGQAEKEPKTRKKSETGRSRKQNLTGSRILWNYVIRIVKLYVIWSVLYWPIDLYNWYHGAESFGVFVKNYVKSFFVSSSIAQLWYLPALALACLIVWGLSRIGFKVWQILIVTGMLFIAGCLGDNWFYTERMPMWFQEWIWWYVPKFVTMRNGVFYGSFYVALGLCFSRKKWRLPFVVSVLGALVSAYLMYKEVKHCSITNMAFFALPAAYCLVEGAMAVSFPDWKLFSRLRSVSEWVYFSHFYFFYLFSWNAPRLAEAGVPLPEINIALFIFVPMLLVSWCLVLLSERERGRWLRKLI